MHAWAASMAAVAIAAGAAGAAAPAPPRPLDVYLRPLVESDVRFDTTRTRATMSAAMRRRYDALLVLLDDELATQLRGLSNDTLRAEWCRRYWALRDPTPTTPENEREAEHASRVLYAEREFAIETPPWFDARGVLWVKLGPPDDVRADLGTPRPGFGYVPTTETWTYRALGLETLVSQPVPGGPFGFGNRRPPLTTRPDLVLRGTNRGDPDYREDPDVPTRDELAGSPRRPEIGGFGVSQRGEMATAAAIEAAGDWFVRPGVAPDAIAFAFDTDAFRGAGGKSRLEAHVQFDLEGLRFAWQDSLYAADYRVEARLLDAAAVESGSDAYVDVVRTRAFRTAQGGVLWPGQIAFEVAPGTYRLALRVLDGNSTAEGTHLADIVVPPFAGSGLQLSDLELASWIAPGDGRWAARFVKRERVVLPNPSGVYAGDRPLVAYLEIYGLQLDARGRCRYEVSYTVRAGTGSAAAPFVTSRFESQGRAADAAEEVRIDIGALEAGPYELEIAVRDRASDAEASRWTRFAIRRGPQATAR